MLKLSSLLSGLFAFVFLADSFAGVFDYSATAIARSHVFAAGLTGNIGYNHYLWGEKTEENPIKYGYMRYYVAPASLLVVNRVATGIQFFPISILGFTIEQQFTHSLTDLIPKIYINCTSSQIECKNLLSESSIKASLVLGYQDFFMVNEFKFYRQSNANSSREYFWDAVNAYLAKQNDQFWGYTGVLGYKYSPIWIYSLVFQRNTASTSLANNQLFFVTAKYAFEKNWAGSLGLGYFSSVTEQTSSSITTKPGPSIIVNITWTGQKGLSL